MSRPSSYNWEGREKSAGQICSEDLGTADLTFKTNPGESRSRGVKTKDAPLSEPKVKPGMRNCLLWQGMDTIPKKVKQIEKKNRNASLWTAGFSHQSLTCLSKLICPSWTMFAGPNPAALTNSQGQGLLREGPPAFHFPRRYSIWFSCQYPFHPSLLKAKNILFAMATRQRVEPCSPQL